MLVPFFLDYQQKVCACIFAPQIEKSSDPQIRIFPTTLQFSLHYPGVDLGRGMGLDPMVCDTYCGFTFCSLKGEMMI